MAQARLERGAALEEVLDPAQAIVDAHHHLYQRPGISYLREEFLRDLGSGHNVVATVFVQALSNYRSEGPEALKPVGETEFAARVAAECSAGEPRVCAAIVGLANLCIGHAVQPVLEEHIAAGQGRFRGIRQPAAWDPQPGLANPAYPAAQDMLASAAFRAGFAHVAPLGLSFDAWLFFHQLPMLTALADAFEYTPIVLNHCGGVIGIGRYAGQRNEVFRVWSHAMSELAKRPNVSVKLGGLGMPLCGFDFDASEAPSSMDLARAWRPWMEHCIETFGTARCMFESNFPADRVSYTYRTGWNAIKRICVAATLEEKQDLFSKTAARIYRVASDG